MFKTIKNSLIFKILLAVIALITAYRITIYILKSQDPVIEDKGFIADVIIVKPEKIKNSFKTYSSLESNQKIFLKTEETGIIKKIIKNEGSSVNKDEIILVLDNDDLYYKKMLEAQSGLKQKELELESISKLFNKGLSSNSKKAEIESGHAGAYAAFLSAEKKYNDRFIKAPFKGILSKLDVKEGQRINSETIIGELTTEDSFKIRVWIPEKYIKFLKLGNTANINLTQHEEVLEGKVLFIGKVIDKNKRSYPVDIIIINNNSELIDGISAKVEIFYEEIEAIKIPNSALILYNNNQLAIKYIDVEDFVNTKKVDIYRSQDDYTYISNNLPLNSKIIIMGQNYLNDKEKVKFNIVNENGINN